MLFGDSLSGTSLATYVGAGSLPHIYTKYLPVYFVPRTHFVKDVHI